MSDIGYKKLEQATDDDLDGPTRRISQSDNDNFPAIQFARTFTILREGDDPVAELEVYRIGTLKQLSQTSEVHWKTEADSALPGRNYEDSSGTLRFENAEAQKTVRVALVNNDFWDTATEFRVVLQQEGLKGGVLGRFLFETRVKIMDNNFFPTDAYRDFNGTDANSRRTSLAFRLPLEFFLMNFRNSSKVRIGTFKHIMVDMVHNLWYLLSLFMGVYLLDHIVNKEAPASQLLFVQDKQSALLLFVGITLTALLIQHYLDYARLSFGIGGTSRSFLECSLIRKYLNYTTKVRGDLDGGQLVMGIHRDIPMCVGSYFHFLDLLKVTGQLSMMIVFKVLGVFLFKTKLDIRSFAGPICYPIFLAIFLKLRSAKTVEKLESKNDAQDKVTNTVQETTSNSILILDHWLRNYVSSHFSDVIKTFNGQAKAAGQVMLNNVYFSRWGATLIVGSYIYLGGVMLLEDLVTTGMFVTNLKVVEAWCKSFEEIYHIIVGICTTVPHFCNLTYLVNLETDLKDRKAQLDMIANESHEVRTTLRRTSGPNEIPADLMQFKCKLGRVNIADWKGSSALSYNCDLRIPQGRLVIVSGGKGAGKATLLKLIAGRYLARLGKDEDLFIPAHLRVLSVQEYPLFFRRNLYENIKYGMKEKSPDASLERVKKICQMLGLENRVLKYFDQDIAEDWYEQFSTIECKLLGIARALVNNFEVTCFHKPTTGVTSEDREHVMNALKQHVEHRGLVCTRNLSMTQKRARSIFMSTQKCDAQLAKYTQDVFLLNQAGSRMMSDMDLAALQKSTDHVAH